MHPSHTRLVSFALLLMILVTSSSVLAETKWPFRRVRPLDPEIGVLIAQGVAASSTFRALVDVLERSDVIVHVDRASVPRHGLAGATHFITRAGGQRYVRITLYGYSPARHAIPLLGHELQHAVEVARAGWVVDQHTCAELFQAIGHPSCDQRQLCFDTEAAVLAGERVSKELLAQAE